MIINKIPPFICIYFSLWSFFLGTVGADVDLLDRAELALRFPYLRLDDIVLGSHSNSGEGWFDNMGLLNGFRTNARYGVPKSPLPLAPRFV